jgi:hypothetical protein
MRLARALSEDSRCLADRAPREVMNGGQSESTMIELQNSKHETILPIPCGSAHCPLMVYISILFDSNRRTIFTTTILPPQHSHTLHVPCHWKEVKAP